jgi:antitoxin component YwqK of YwqJK toxin-antitoxin module
LEDREGVAYLKNSDSPYTGKSFEFHDNGQKKSEENFKDGKPHGIGFNWYENGQKEAETNFKDGTLISSKFWNSKGEEVDSVEEAKQ